MHARPFVCLAPVRLQKKTRVTADDVSRAVRNAQLTCAETKDRKSCAIAWEEVEELSSALHKSFVKD
jgi:hypothetical protein